MLKQIREYLEANGPCESSAVALYLAADVSAVRGMLEFLEQRGQVKRIDVDCAGGCAGCTGCLSRDNARSDGRVTFWSRGRRDND